MVMSILMETLHKLYNTVVGTHFRLPPVVLIPIRVNFGLIVIQLLKMLVILQMVAQHV